MKKNSKLWGGRFKQELADLAKHASYSLCVDQVLFPYDIQASLAHVRMLKKQRLIPSASASQLEKGLKAVLKQFQNQSLSRYASDFEDVHTFIQLQLEKKVGEAAKMIHTGRSRNDLVVTATLLYLRDEVKKIIQTVSEFQRALVDWADQHQAVAIPGYTHLQRAQVVSLAHHVLAYVEMLARDKTRLLEVLNRLSVLPLGAGALSGSSLPLDRAFLAKQLQFHSVNANSLDAVSDRDSFVEVLSDLSILWMHLSRFSEDWILWASQEFHFITLSDRWSTGSSLMPHKKNPDLLELTRGRSGRVFGNLVSLLTTLKGLPLSYNRDLQEDKLVLVQSIRLTLLTLPALSGLVKDTQVNTDSCERACADSFLYATDLLEYLVKKGVVFRKAHETVGRLVAHCLDRGIELADLPLNEFREFAPLVKEDVYELFCPHTSLSAKKTVGSPAPLKVKAQLASWKKRLKRSHA
jgi:argininosuccinate lyase